MGRLSAEPPREICREPNGPSQQRQNRVGGRTKRKLWKVREDRNEGGSSLREPAQPPNALALSCEGVRRQPRNLATVIYRAAAAALTPSAAPRPGYADGDATASVEEVRINLPRKNRRPRRRWCQWSSARAPQRPRYAHIETENLRSRTMIWPTPDRVTRVTPSAPIQFCCRAAKVVLEYTR